MLDALHFCNDLAQKAINNLLLSPGETASSLGIDARYQDDYYELSGQLEMHLEVLLLLLIVRHILRQLVHRMIDSSTLQIYYKPNKKLIAHEAVAFMNDLGKYGSFSACWWSNQLC